jgi:hypothetical protein
MPSPYYNTGARYGVRALLGTSNISDIDVGMQAMRDDVENKFSGYASGTHAARLAATNIDGLLWRETDTGLVYVGTGTTWTAFATTNIARGQIVAGAGNLRTTTKSASYTAADGDYVIVTASCTITLPTPAANAIVGIVAGSAITGSAPVTITTSTGQMKLDAPSSVATSITLGIAGAYIVLQADGTNWYPVAGQSDTGWVPLTLGSGITAVAGDYTPAARLIGDGVELRGEIQGSWGSGATLATVAYVSMRPASSPAPSVSVWNGGSYIAQALNVSTGGAFSVLSAISSGAIYLDGVRYRVL